MLANVYLHYVLDLWFDRKLQRKMKGYIKEIRYCDDFVILVQFKEETRKIRHKLEERLAKFGLELSIRKTKVIEFGRYAEENAKRRGEKPDTFNFLGFTHYCGKTRKGYFKVGRKTSRKKFAKKIRQMNQWLRKIRNKEKLKEWWKKLKSKLHGHYQYYGISGNSLGIKRFYEQTCKLVLKWINRRSQKRSMTLEEFSDYLERFPLPVPKIKHNLYTL